MCRILIALASLFVEQGLLGTQVSVARVPRLLRTGSLIEVQGLSYPEVCGIVQGPGSNLSPLFWQVDS